jgi:hypothetical protein
VRIISPPERAKITGRLSYYVTICPCFGGGCPIFSPEKWNKMDFTASNFIKPFAIEKPWKPHGSRVFGILDKI